MPHDAPSGRISAGEGRVFALTLAGAFTVLSLLLLWRRQENAARVTGGLAAAALLAALFFPRRLGWVKARWMQFGEALGRVTTPVLMALIYVVVVTPLAVLWRATRRPERRHHSAWHARPPPADRAQLERQF